MSDKHLTAKEWQKLAAGRGFKDAALVKALEGTEKARNAPPSEQLAVPARAGRHQANPWSACAAAPSASCPVHAVRGPP